MKYSYSADGYLSTMNGIMNEIVFKGTYCVENGVVKSISGDSSDGSIFSSTFTYNSNHIYTYTWNNLAVGEYSITVNESNENNNKYIASYEPVHFTVYKKAINPNDINVMINPGKGNVTINIEAPTDLTNTMSIIIDGKNYNIPVIGGTGNNTIILTPGLIQV